MCGANPRRKNGPYCDSCAAKYQSKRCNALRARGLCTTCGQPTQPGKWRCDKHLAISNISSKASHQVVRQKVFAGYGGPICACCGCEWDNFLTLDHIHGGGTRDHRRTNTFYRRLIAANFPDGYQVLCQNCNWGKRYRDCCPHKGLPAMLTYDQKRKARIKREVMDHYGGPTCACCNESMLEFLTMDHIAGGGRRHHQQGGTHNNICAWLKKNSYPRGYQVLCMNCNWAKHKNGVCPHQGQIIIPE